VPAPSPVDPKTVSWASGRSARSPL